MCVSLPLGDLNSGFYLPHPTSIYTYRVIIAPRVCGDNYYLSLLCGYEYESLLLVITTY